LYLVLSRKIIHILNGDSLKDAFPKQISGEVIVARECLVDGPVSGDTFEEFFNTRANFISNFYGDYSIESYYRDSVSEFEKVINITPNSEVNLWFEDDLFCQVNFWFVCYLLFNRVVEPEVFLVRPQKHDYYGFGGFSEKELIELYKGKMRVSEMESISALWESYRENNGDQLLAIAEKLSDKYPFMLTAVNAHLERRVNKNEEGRPIRALREIIAELGTDDFVPVFREFNRRESIYGFGDLQVRRLLDRINGNSKTN